MQSFERVYAPFDGVITARNVNVGQLVDSGSNGGTGSSSNPGGNISTTGTVMNGPQELFHVSSMDTVRIFVNVPGVYVSGSSTRSENKHRFGRISRAAFSKGPLCGRRTRST